MREENTFLALAELAVLMNASNFFKVFALSC